MRPDPLDFWKKYKLVSSSKTYVAPKEKSTTCRYCNKTNKEVSFSQATHLLPELIGENNIYTTDECDDCNKLFSDFESNFSVFIRPYITLLGVKGKKKIPEFHSRTIDSNEETRTVLKHAKGNRKELKIQDIEDYSLNTDKKTLDIVFRKPPFVPLKVYKSLLKIGLSLLPNEFDNANKLSFEWLTNRKEHLELIPFAFITTLKKKSFATPFAELYRAKKLVKGKSEFPEHILILCFANQIIQIFLPFSDELKKVHNGKRILSVNLFPAFAFDKIEAAQNIEIKTYNLGIATSVTENHQISFSYQSAVFHGSENI
jgi:hypothetical protein